MEEGVDEHIIEAIGKCRVVIRNGRVVEVGEPEIRACPLAEKFAFPVREITPGEVAKNIEARIRTFGMCTPGRDVIEDGEFVGFGASELIASGLRAGILDAAVIACDGAGTVVAPGPGLVQGIGGRMSGLVKTSPIPEVIRKIEAAGGVVADRAHASISQPGGTALAYSLRFNRVAVTVATPRDAEDIRRDFPKTLIIGVHSTGLTPGEAGRMVRAADIVTACASGTVREAAGAVALLQAGTAVPVFAITPRGRDLILSKVANTNGQFLVQMTKLPVSGPRVPEPLV